MAEEIFNADELAAEQVQANDPPPAEQQQEDRPRDEQGRFAPKAGEEQPPAEEQPGDKSGTVPQGALHAERERRKEAENKWREAQTQLQAIADMRARVAAAKPQETAAPAGDDDASQLAYLRQRVEQAERTANGVAQDRQTEQVDNLERQHLSTALSTAEAEFRAQRPDYDAAVGHVVQARAQELALYGLNPMQVQQTLQQEVLDITRSAIAQGRSPAEVAYQLATLRGYRPETGEQASAQPNPAAAQVAAVAAARQGSRSLGQASGAAPPKDLNAQTIAAMSEDEFDALYSTPEGRRMIDNL
jgi:hypothetical protein